MPPMVLHTRRWGFPRAETVLCIHGAGQHGGVFEALARRLTAKDLFVLAPDLRGHGESGREPPWDSDTHVEDVIETLDDLGVERAAVLGHSFGGLIAAKLANAATERVSRLVLLDPGIELPPEQAFKYAEIDRLDWSFSTPDGALNALLGSDRIVAAPREVVAAFVKDDVKRGADGMYRFSYNPSATAVVWSEATRKAPPVAQVPTLIVRAVASFIDGRAQDRRYRQELGSQLTIKAVPNGHNVLWEAPAESEAAIEEFLTAG
jgi:lipase